MEMDMELQFVTNPHYLDDDENVKAMRDTARRIRLTQNMTMIAENLVIMARYLADGDLDAVEAGVESISRRTDEVLEMLGEQPTDPVYHYVGPA
jgi:hypothetical protein